MEKENVLNKTIYNFQKGQINITFGKQSIIAINIKGLKKIIGE